MSRIVPSADLTVYVSPTGSDSTGDGTSGNPWATPQHAVDVLYADYDFQGKYAATVQLAIAAAGQSPYFYPGVVMSGRLVGQGGTIPPQAVSATAPPFVYNKYHPFTIQGDTTGTNPLGAFINPGYQGRPTGPCVALTEGAALRIRGFGMSTYYSTQDMIDVFQNSFLDVGDVWFGQSGPTGQYNHMSVAWGSTIHISSKYTISGSAASHIGIGGAGATVISNTNGDPALGITIKVEGNNNFPAGFALIDNGIFYASGLYWDVTGTQTGPRAVICRNGVLQTNGGGSTNGGCSAHPLPGNQPAIVQDNGVCR